MSSASKFNGTIDDLVLDLTALYRSSLESARESTSFTEKTFSELRVLEKETEELDELASGLILMAADVEGFTEFVCDNFPNTDKISLEDTTANIDNRTQTIQLPIDKQSRIPTNLSPADIQFNVLTRNQLISNQPEPDSDPINAMRDADRVWLQRISFLRPPPEFQGEYIVRLLVKSEISKIVVKPITADKGSITNLIIQYSSDGINWVDVDGEGNKRLLTDTVFLFNPVKSKFWRFLYLKAGYDEFAGGKYSYEIGARAIEFFGVEHLISAERISEAELFSLPQDSENSFEFNKASLKACEVVPTGTSIDYQIAFLSETDRQNFLDGVLDLPDLNFSDIDPVNREIKTKPVVVDGAQITPLQNFAAIYGLDSLTNHRYKSNTNNVLVDVYTLTSSVTEDSIEVFRNLGDNTLDAGGNAPVQVNSIDNGWVLEGDFYSAEFFISEPNGRIVDFGPEFVEIDTIRSSGRINLSNGKHKIRTNRRNWLSIRPATVTAPGDINPDLLYPYNHKYLIEGMKQFLYGVDLDSDIGGGTTRRDIIDANGVYLPAEKYWGKTLKKIAIFDFAFKIQDNDFTVFTIIEDVNGDKRVLMKYDTEPNLFTNEKFAIIENRITGSLFKYIVLRAILKSTNKSSSPVLDSYIIRLGL